MKRSVRAHRALLPLLALVALASSTSALAESGSALNVHIEPGAAFPLFDPLRTRTGQGFSIKFDHPLIENLAVQAQFTALSFRQGQYFAPGTRVGGGAGLRYRILDDRSGHLICLHGRPETHQGNLFGNLWVDANLVVLQGQGAHPGLDLGIGVEASIADALQIGPFVRFLHFGAEQIAHVGISISVGVPDTSVHDDDADRDQVPLPQDQCPDEPEDHDGFQDEDGCPDPDTDRDGDGVLDATDRCPDEPEDRDGFEDEDGCPEPDNDRDGIADATDRCPNEPEDRDGFEDEDGCPDPDNDGDGIPDVTDQCPLEPETRNGVDDEDGCPEKETKAYVAETKVVITEKIFFAFNEAQVLPQSFPLLDSVVALLQRFSGIRKLRVEGHTDDVGTETYNQELSQRRAKAIVDYLVSRGIAAERLEAVGYGKSRPLVPGSDDASREQNRRVEFTITDPADGNVRPDET